MKEKDILNFNKDKVIEELNNLFNCDNSNYQVVERNITTSINANTDNI